MPYVAQLLISRHALASGFRRSINRGLAPLRLMNSSCGEPFSAALCASADSAFLTSGRAGSTAEFRIHA